MTNDSSGAGGSTVLPLSLWGDRKCNIRRIKWRNANVRAGLNDNSMVLSKPGCVHMSEEPKRQVLHNRGHTSPEAKYPVLIID